jgi:class 3 adenylate cyclase/tetratricopeptide (TPR) repeat protein
MQCPRCSGDNSATSSFCDACGAPLNRTCAACGHINRAGSRFCGQCGARFTPSAAEVSQSSVDLLPSSDVGVEERKHVTVLFADISNSTSLIQDMDPELGMLRLQPVLNSMKEAVDRYEGIVSKMQGDGIMALFGTPKPHEDHAVRGCLAGLAMQDAVTRLADPSLNIRVGLHTGEVVFHNRHHTYDVTGANVHLASRMEHMAEKGKILLTADTFAAAKQFIDAKSLGPQVVRGVSRPVEVFELTELKHAPASEYFRRGPRPSPLSGRKNELAALELELVSVMQDEARVVGMVGEAGLGKSRLCFEFGEACRRRNIRVLEARVLEHGGATPFQPVLDLLRDFFGIKSKEPVTVSQQRVIDLLRSRGDFNDTLPLLLEFLGIPDPARKVPKLHPDTRKLRLLHFIRQLVRSRPRDEIVVVLVEDLHWIDLASLDFIEALADAIIGTKTLLLLNFRPGFSAPWMQFSHYRQIGLAPLRPTAANQLLHDLLGDDTSLVSLRKNIAERAQGNPFFMEELVRAVVDRGNFEGQAGAYHLKDDFAAFPLPATVQAVIAARIDRLGEPTKQILQTAAVIGREVPLTILERVTGLAAPAVAEIALRLRRAELLYELPPFDQGVLAFRHPLIQEVAYQSLLHSRRRELHAAAAQAIETHFKDRVQERAGLLAFHFEQAGQSLKAAQYYMGAAVWVGANDSGQALRHWKKIRELLIKEPPAQATNYLRMMANGQIVNFGWREGMSADEGQIYFEEARRLALAASDGRANALIHAAYGRILAASGSADEYVAKIREAEALATGSKDASLQVTLKAVLCHALRLAGRMSEALHVNIEATDHANDIGKFDRQMLGFDIEPWLTAMRGQTLVMLGRGDEARPYLDRILQMEEGNIDAIHHAVPSFGYMDLAWATCDTVLAERHANRLSALAASSGIPYLQAYSKAYQGLLQVIAGRLDAAIDQLASAVAFARERGAGLENEARILADLANAYRLKGDLDSAQRSAVEAIEVATARHARAPECLARLVLAEARGASVAVSDRSAADGEVNAVERLVQETGAMIYNPIIESLKLRLAKTGEPLGRATIR